MRAAALALLLLPLSLVAQDVPPIEDVGVPCCTLALTTVSAANIQDGAGNLLNGVLWIYGQHFPVTNGAASFQVSAATSGTLNIDDITGHLIFALPVGIGIGTYDLDAYVQPAIVTSTGTGIPYWNCVDGAEYFNTVTSAHYYCNGSVWVLG